MPTEWAVAVKGGEEGPRPGAIYVAGEKEHEKQELVRQRGIPVNRNQQSDLQTVRDGLGIAGYETYF